VTLGELRPTMRVPRGRCSLDERRHYRSFRGLSSSRQPKASAFAQAVVFTRREFSGMELDEVVHARRRLASELEEVVTHAVRAETDRTRKVISTLSSRYIPSRVMMPGGFLT
jgi:hypothetical protein